MPWIIQKGRRKPDDHSIRKYSQSTHLQLQPGVGSTYPMVVPSIKALIQNFKRVLAQRILWLNMQLTTSHVKLRVESNITIVDLKNTTLKLLDTPFYALLMHAYRTQPNFWNILQQKLCRIWIYNLFVWCNDKLYITVRPPLKSQHWRTRRTQRREIIAELLLW